MRPAVRNIILNAPLPIIPASVRPSCLAWWDGAKKGSVWAGLTNLVANGDFSNGTTGWTAYRATQIASGGVLTNTADGTYAYGMAFYNTNTAYVSGNKVYVRAKARLTNTLCTLISMDMRGSATGGNNPSVSQSTPVQNQWYTISGITIPSSGTGNYRLSIVHNYADATTANGKVMEVQYVLALDLTATFGAGNEPTAAEMDAILASEPAYWDGARTVLANPSRRYNVTQLVTNGKSQTFTAYANLANAWGTITLIKNHVYYTKRRFVAVSGTMTAAYSRIASIGSPSITFIDTGASSAIQTFTGENRTGVLTAYGSSTPPCEVRHEDVIFVDLTADFCGGVVGTGLEPTAAQMDAWLAKAGITYFDGVAQVEKYPESSFYWADYSGNNRHLKLNNFAYLAGSGWNGDTLMTDGVDDYGIRQDAWSAANQSFTTMAVFSVANLTGTKYILLGTNNTTVSMYLYIGNDSLYVYLGDSVSGTASAYTIVAAQKRYFAVGVYDQATKKGHLYINGVYVGETAAISNGINTITKLKTGINAAENAYSAQSVRALAAFNRALSGAEVWQIYNNNKRRWGVG